MVLVIDIKCVWVVSKQKPRDITPNSVIRMRAFLNVWDAWEGGVGGNMTCFDINISRCLKFHPASTISTLNESCDI